MEIDTRQLEELMQLLTKHGFDEIEIARGEERVVLRRGPEEGAFQALPEARPAPAQLPASAQAQQAPAETAEPERAEPGVTYITSPFVGTFYRAASPDAEPFVDSGQDVEPGQVLCIVEAMKLMNEIEAEMRGTILDILVDNGTPVEYGARLFKVRAKG